VSYTKRQIISQAFDEIGLASYIFDLQPEQLQSALRKLDSMMATWNAQGIRLGYPIPSTPEGSDLDTESNIPDAANEAVYQNLAIKLAPSYGKIVPVETKASARMSYNAMLARFMVIPEFKLDGTMPAGAGNKNIYQVFLDTPEDRLIAGPDNELEF
jgi:hypothetical protein